MGPQMEAKNERIDEEPGEEEELDVSNLLVTKSERAPTTEPPPVRRGSKRDGLRTMALAAFGTVAVAALVELLWRFFTPRTFRDKTPE
jgi:hypothetical protein